MIVDSYRSIFTSTSQVVVNPVNCVGVMGKGLALEFKQRYPKMYKDYSAYCAQGRLKPGEVLITKDRYKTITGEYRSYRKKQTIIICCATKNHWRDKSKLKWVKNGINAINLWMLGSPYNEISIPALGCGLGGLDWPIVYAYIKEVFGESKFVVKVYHPHHLPKLTYLTVGLIGQTHRS